MNSQLNILNREIQQQQSKTEYLDLTDYEITHPVEVLIKKVYCYKKGILSLMSSCISLYQKTRGIFQCNIFKYLDALVGDYVDDSHEVVRWDNSPYVVGFKIQQGTNEIKEGFLKYKSFYKQEYSDDYILDFYDFEPLFHFIGENGDNYYISDFFKICGFYLKLYDTNKFVPKLHYSICETTGTQDMNVRKKRNNRLINGFADDEFYLPLYNKGIPPIYKEVYKLNGIKI